jgi:rhomboid protease GluP
VALINDEQREVAEIISFQVSYSRQHIKATWGLAIVIALTFLLEELFGGSTSTSVLVRMGANVKELVSEGQYFRLMSSVFLHSGYMHVFFNTYVLFALGGFFNRILGEAKYLTVFFVSGIAGSLASFYLGKAAISVGASGAIWGLFGASLALAFFKTRLIPEAIRLRLRKVTLINLAINLGVSFLPMVDMWAHIGGGVAGFLCSLLMIFHSNSQAINRLKTHLFQFLATFLFLTYLVSMVFVIASYRPWQDQFSADLVEVPLVGVPFSVEIPKGLALKKSEEGQAPIFLFGDLTFDQMVIELQFYKDQVPSQQAQEWLSSQQKQLLQDPTVGSDIKRSLDLRNPAGGPELFYKLEPKGDFVAFTFVIVREGYAIKMIFVSEKSTPQAQVEKLARQVIDSIKSTSNS